MNPGWKIYPFAFVLTSAAFACACSPSAGFPGEESSARGAPLARSGSLDLRAWNFARQGPVDLEGEWEFYWRQLLAPGDFPVRERPVLVAVPGAWNGKPAGAAAGGEKIGSFGFATYRLRILLPPGPAPPLALKILEAGTAYRLYANGVVAAENGQVGRDREAMRPRYLPGIFALPAASRSKIDSTPAAAGSRAENGTLELVLQVSNYHHRLGGPRYEIRLGTPDQIRYLRERALFLEWLLVGCLAIMAVYHFGYFLNRRRQKGLLYFALFCVLLATRTLVTGERFLFYLLPGIDWELGQKLEFLSFYAAAPMFGLFLFESFRAEFHAFVLRVYQILPPLFCAVVLVAPARIFTWTAPAFQLLSVFFFAHALWVLGRAIRHKRSGARSFLAGLVLFLLAFLNDVLFAYGVIQSWNLIPLGAVAFICSQAYSLSRRFAYASATAEKLTANLEAQVSERTRQLEVAVEKSESSSRAKSEFLANMSHEIRTPMNSILGYTQLSLDSKELPGEVREYLNIVDRRGQDLKALINDILDISRMEAGRLQIDPRALNLRDLVREVAESFVPAVQEKGLEFRTVIDPATPEEIVTDPLRLRQLILNLTANAIKFTESGFVHIVVEPLADGAAPAGRAVRLRFAVRDSGIGVPAYKQELIFGLFTQGDSSTTRKFGGTGLGLHICSQLVALMGGEIGVRSEVGRGSEFFFEIVVPRVTEAAGAEQVDREEPPAGPSGFRVLIADDDDLNSNLIKKFLQPVYEVAVAESGYEVLERIEAEHFDLILMDGQMPGLDGFETTRRIRQAEIGGGRRVPIVALTGLSMEGDRQRCIEAGMDEYLSKPIEKKLLLRTIRRILR